MRDGEDDRFGPYRLLGLIGQGGMGEVHRAVDSRKDRVVALKRLPAGLATDAGFQARFRREAQVAARLSEPHVIPIHDYGEIDGRLYVDMRLVDGVDLSALLVRDGALPVPRAVGIVRQIAAALDAAHRSELVHRDVKPSNVLVTGADDFVYLIDFGIARTSDPSTTGSAFLGTAAYAAPERFCDDGSVTDHRVDVYSLGCVLYEVLTGRGPFTGGGIAGLIYAPTYVAPPRPSDHDPALAPFDAVVARAMAKDPAQRHPSAGDLATDVAAAGEAVAAAARPARRRRPRPRPRSYPPPEPPDVQQGRAARPVVDVVGVAVVLLFVCWAAGLRLWHRLDDGAAAAVVPIAVAAVVGPAVGYVRHRLVDRHDTPAAVFAGAVASLGIVFPQMFAANRDALVSGFPLTLLLAALGCAVAVTRWSRDPAHGRRAARIQTYLGCVSLALIAVLMAVTTFLAVPPDGRGYAATSLYYLAIGAVILLATTVVLRLPVPDRRPLGTTLAVAVTVVWFESMWDVVDRLSDYNVSSPPDGLSQTLALASVAQFFLVLAYVVVLVGTLVRLLWSVVRRRSRAGARPTLA